MTKEQAIEFIEKCSDEDIYGFFVCAVSKEDIACKCDIKTNNDFNNLSDENKKSYLSNLADELETTYQEEHFSDDFNEVNFYELTSEFCD